LRYGAAQFTFTTTAIDPRIHSYDIVTFFAGHRQPGQGKLKYLQAILRLSIKDGLPEEHLRLSHSRLTSSIKLHAVNQARRVVE
jgi:hypothetical protein